MHEASRRILSVLLQKVEGFASAKKTTVVCATNRFASFVQNKLTKRFRMLIMILLLRYVESRIWTPP